MNTKLAEYQRWFEDEHLRLDTSYKAGKTIMSTQACSTLCTVMALVLKEINKST